MPSLFRLQLLLLCAPSSLSSSSSSFFRCIFIQAHESLDRKHDEIGCTGANAHYVYSINQYENGVSDCEMEKKNEYIQIDGEQQKHSGWCSVFKCGTCISGDRILSQICREGAKRIFRNENLFAFRFCLTNTGTTTERNMTRDAMQNAISKMSPDSKVWNRCVEEDDGSKSFERISSHNNNRNKWLIQLPHNCLLHSILGVIGCGKPTDVIIAANYFIATNTILIDSRVRYGRNRSITSESTWAQKHIRNWNEAFPRSQHLHCIPFVEPTAACVCVKKYIIMFSFTGILVNTGEKIKSIGPRLNK